MKSSIKEKVMWGVLIFVLEFAVLITIANIFDLETVNSLFAFVAIFILFGTIAGFLFKIIIDHKEELSNMDSPLLLSLSGSSMLSELKSILVTIVIVLIGLLIFLIVDGLP